jgi:hypothetical protein
VPCFVDLETIKEYIPESAYFSVWESEDKERLLEIIIDKNTARNLIPSLARKGAKKISVQLVSMLYE